MNFLDVSAVVDGFQGSPGAGPLYPLDLYGWWGSDRQLHDISGAVDGFRGKTVLGGVALRFSRARSDEVPSRVFGGDPWSAGLRKNRARRSVGASQNRAAQGVLLDKSGGNRL